MKNLIKLLSISFILLAISAGTFAQVSATADASATIVTPITITNTTDLNFGNVYVSATVAGTVVITPAGVRSVTGGAGLPAVAGGPTAAAFTVTGTAGASYAITLPAGATTIANAGGQTMTVNTWTSSPNPTGTLTGGTETLSIGATLNVANAQATGTYNTSNAGGSGEFTVTVNYN